MTSAKTMLYVGGLADEVTPRILKDVFLPFGDIADVSMPLDAESGKHRGFAFVDFEIPEDASAAIDNMSLSELYGRVLKVNYSMPQNSRFDAIWSNRDEYEKKKEKEDKIEKEKKDEKPDEIVKPEKE